MPRRRGEGSSELVRAAVYRPCTRAGSKCLWCVGCNSELCVGRMRCVVVRDAALQVIPGDSHDYCIVCAPLPPHTHTQPTKRDGLVVRVLLKKPHYSVYDAHYLQVGVCGLAQDIERRRPLNIYWGRSLNCPSREPVIRDLVHVNLCLPDSC